MKIRPVVAEMFHADGRTERQRADRQTDMTKLIVAFRNFANATKKRGVTSGITETLQIAGTKINNGVTSRTYRHVNLRKT